MVQYLLDQCSFSITGTLALVAELAFSFLGWLELIVVAASALGLFLRFALHGCDAVAHFGHVLGPNRRNRLMILGLAYLCLAGLRLWAWMEAWGPRVGTFGVLHLLVGPDAWLPLAVRANFVVAIPILMMTTAFWAWIFTRVLIRVSTPRAVPHYLEPT